MSRYSLSERVYGEMLELLNNQHFTECQGCKDDMNFLTDDWWLRDTAVIENIVKREGMWEIHLVFAHYIEPQKLIKRLISRCSSRKKAILSAGFMRRLAAKDQRGTLKVNIEDFGLCLS